jgi:hypothetical protein
MDDLKLVLLATLEGFDHIHVILDALDECPKSNGEREKLLNLIRDIHEWSDCRLHILATSRQERDIEDAIVPLLEKLNERPISIQSALSDEDISLYISSQLKSSKFNRWPSEIKQEVQGVLTEKADGM